MVSDSTVGAAISGTASKPTKTQIRSARKRRQKAAARGPDWVAPVVPEKRPSAGPSAGPSRSQERKIAKKLRNKALKAACKAAEQAIDLAGNAAEPSQKPAFLWQPAKPGTKRAKGPTLPAKERLAAAQAVLSSLQAAEPLQVDVSRDGPSGTGGRDAGMCSTGQTLTHKSRRISRVGSDGKQLAQVAAEHHPEPATV